MAGKKRKCLHSSDSTEHAGMDVQRSVIEVYLVDKDHTLYLLYTHSLCAVICTIPVIQALPLCCNIHCTCYTSTASVL